jgi:LAGLIDADG endonuclease
MFRIGQHERDIKLMEILIKYLSAGKLYKNSNEPFVNLTIYKLTEIKKIIIPFFEKNPLFGIKHLDFLDFCKVVKLMVERKHLTLEGLDQIRKIKSGMNRNRKFTDN